MPRRAPDVRFLHPSHLRAQPAPCGGGAVLSVPDSSPQARRPRLTGAGPKEKEAAHYAASIYNLHPGFTLEEWNLTRVIRDEGRREEIIELMRGAGIA